MATNISVYWTDGLGGRPFDPHSRNGRWDICQRKLLARDLTGDLRGEDARGLNWLAHNLSAKHIQIADCPEEKIGMCGSRKEKISMSLPWNWLLEIPGGWQGLEVQISRGCEGEKSNVFPEGPRALSEENLPISHLRFD